MKMTAKQVVEMAKDKNELKDDKFNLFYLTHTYDEKQSKVWVKAPYNAETFEVICAYIQYECFELEDGYGMGQEDVLKVLEKFYGCSGTFSVSKEEKKSGIKIDLYENWEIYCGLANDIQNIKTLKREGMNDLLSEFVEEFYVKRIKVTGMN
ncbi:hypothetical protein [Paenibacillus silvae]|uniref:Uncharacterized protein n=1 Tax=Paenibacillus silvae TaxID=1325358 RepID=A0A2W6NND6_9BACL|nr:hypothetical protein [Paenibacillus silvae]PZT57362.1 hypothetical protein DN757_01520 [Paenibacillus silvae]